MFNSLFTKKTLAQQPVTFRIEAIVSDGMWYSLSKWQKMSNVTEEELIDYVDDALEKGIIVQSPTGAKSYRMPRESIENWYKKHGYDLYKDQLLDFVFKPRIWNNLTEPEGFLQAPVREIGVVSFVVDPETSKEVIKALKGIARVRETEPGKYKAYGLNSTYIKNIVLEVVNNNCGIIKGSTKVYSRQVSKRREMVDFDKKFSEQLVLFYKEFGKTLVKQSLKTISIFIPTQDEQDAQVLMWVLEAIEKFDESASVPFSGYLDNVLKRWPYNLPNVFLGKELSQFQKDRAKAIDNLKIKSGNNDLIFSHESIAEEMDINFSYFSEMEEKHRTWIGTKNPESLMWEDKGDEKTDVNSESISNFETKRGQSDRSLAHIISLSAVKTAIETGEFSDCLVLTTQIDSGDIKPESIAQLSSEFINTLGKNIVKGKKVLKIDVE